MNNDQNQWNTLTKLFSGGLWGFADAALFGVFVSCTAMIYCAITATSLQEMLFSLGDFRGGTLILLGWTCICLFLVILDWLLMPNKVAGFIGSSLNPSTPIRFVFAIMLLVPGNNGSIIQNVIIAPSLRLLLKVFFTQ